MFRPLFQTSYGCPLTTGWFDEARHRHLPDLLLSEMQTTVAEADGPSIADVDVVLHQVGACAVLILGSKDVRERLHQFLQLAPLVSLQTLPAPGRVWRSSTACRVSADGGDVEDPSTSDGDVEVPRPAGIDLEDPGCWRMCGGPPGCRHGGAPGC